MKSLDRAIFLDKDGTLIKDVPFNVDPQKVFFSKGAEVLLSNLKHAYQFYVITNQAGIAQGLFEEKDLGAVEERLKVMFEQVGAILEGLYYCPHHPEGKIPAYRTTCLCRKPASGMLEKASQEHKIDLHKSWMIGDILDDIEAGKRAGVRTIFLDVGHETLWDLSPMRIPDFRVRTLEEAALVILQEGER